MLLARALWLGLLILSSVPGLAVDRISFGGRFGTGGVINEYFTNVGVLVYNQSASSLAFQFSSVSGANTTTPLSFALSPTLGGTAVFDDTSVPTTVHTIPAGQTWFFHTGSQFHVAIPTGADLGLHSCIPSMYYKKDGSLNSVTFATREVFFTGTGVSSTQATASGACTVAAGLTKGGGGTTSGTECSFGTLILGSVPPTGYVAVSGLVGTYVGQLYIDGALIDTEEVTGATPTTEGPEWLWQTTTPALYVTKEMEIKVNGKIVWAQTIVPDLDGNFGINLEFNPLNPEYLQPVLAPDGTPVPLPADDVTNGNDDNPEGARPDPAPIPGPEPSTDTDSSLSVADHYRATRAALEDALNPRSNVPRFNADDWIGDDSATGDARGNAAGQSVGGLADSLNGSAAGIPDLSVPGLGGADGLSFTIWGFSFTLSPAPYASLVRSFLLVFLVIFFWINAVKIVRGAFTTVT